MTRAIRAARAGGALSRTSCNQPVRHEQSLETDHQQEALRFVPVKTSCTSFKAARRAARAANMARTPQLPLALPQRRRLTPVGRREKPPNQGPPWLIRVLNVRAVDKLSRIWAAIGSKCAPEPWYCPAREKPVKAACDRRATASVDVPGGRTRKCGLDRASPCKPQAYTLFNLRC